MSRLIFFSAQVPVILIAVSKGKGVTGIFYNDKALKNFNGTTVNAVQRVELRILDFSTTTLLSTKQVV